jgi:DNA ligase-1
VLPWLDGRVLPFTELQRRIGRKNLSAKILSEVPVILQVYDLLEFEGSDIRQLDFRTRREMLEGLIDSLPENLRTVFKITESVDAADWKDLAARREESRNLGVEGFMLKRRESPYRTGRHRGDWWKWKIDPLTVDAVLIYAQKGSGKRSNLFTDYTFCGLARWRACSIREGVFGIDRCRDSRRRSLRARQHDRNVRTRAQRETAVGFRDCIRSDPKIDTA